jgi:hypothetical protein
LQVVPDCSASIFEQSVKANVTPRSTVKTDCWIGAKTFLMKAVTCYIHDHHIAEKKAFFPFFI